ncbi:MULTISPECIES: type II toxin-antitoxin system RelE/ParE family toxin [unclassified Microcystis]|jgi:toxin ParE1/3/4|uniref:Type II toxin-antitoxin system RelE/ParE family toxin n=1 Tax=Microcystis flos-aquae Mf_QC_C_20070823_S10D TaxID=2486236 RepID=A0A552L4Q0_9CHRO|nr:MULTISPECIES: type II toxin-antitoxin system RelE/ParE family toxin [unclassified Microcystis]MCA2816917.1 type II toxin-antitoxin system RelE/ParE family toxin [Microcystis sp. M085S1]MCA2854156.1 type II toxin-antitoxin system RelE/ParE family toxin [Microcystis sp. M065S1]TRT81346.1 MAG: type II toxin-antitoxin system RelE/ParE family toxin [Microcystis flos-aquae Ma_QC_C_20070823_S18]TRT94770.1 MAG: type II toxin-antitoxin system RelE/ParE family toxin [Microcystis flos-aquae Ma_QC_C_200
MTRYIIAPSASQDLNKIADYFLVVNIEAGEKLFRKFYKKCQQLVQFPKLGRSYSHIKPSLRGLPLDGYIIFYRVINETVENLRIVNGRQDLDALFSEIK